MHVSSFQKSRGAAVIEEDDYINTVPYAMDVRPGRSREQQTPRSQDDRVTEASAR